MRTYALVGKSLKHSFSSKYFLEKFLKEGITNCKYINLEIDNILDLKRKITELEIIGFNITIPYKQEIIPLLDFISKNAKNIVSTVKMTHNIKSPFCMECFFFISIHP